MKKWMLALVAVAMLSLFAANRYEKPKTVIHVVTVKWKPGTTPEQIKAAVKGVEKVAFEYSGIKNIWTETLKVQGEGYQNAFVMEFKDKASFDAYTDSPAQKAWYEVYLPIRAQSTTHDITN